MARGQYEIPPGLPRPRPAFGPCRPPPYPSRIVAASSPTSVASSPTSPVESPGKQDCRADVVVFSTTKSEQFEKQFENVKRQLGASARFEEIDTYDQALRALSKRPSVVVMSEDALHDPSLEPVAAQYIRNGATLCTDLARLPSSIQRCLKPGNESFYAVASQQLAEAVSRDQL